MARLVRLRLGDSHAGLPLVGVHEGDPGTVGGRRGGSMGAMGKATVSYRHNAAGTMAAVVMMIAMMSFAVWAPYLLVLLVIPLALAVWNWRAGTDVDADGLTVTAALGRRRIPWSQVAGFVRTPRGRVAARLTGGVDVELPAVSEKDLPQLVQVSGTELVTDPS